MDYGVKISVRSEISLDEPAIGFELMEVDLTLSYEELYRVFCEIRRPDLVDLFFPRVESDPALQQ
jgi:hypothetical protein